MENSNSNIIGTKLCAANLHFINVCVLFFFSLDYGKGFRNNLVICFC